jgi:hypothetical protein
MDSGHADSFTDLALPNINTATQIAETTTTRCTSVDTSFASSEDNQYATKMSTVQIPARITG